MRRLLVQRLELWSLVALLMCAWPHGAQADPIIVRHVQGTLHGFLELRSGGGLVVASGDVTQVVHGDRITTETLFRFKDGSIDDEVTVFSQHRTLQLITDHHVQKGPSFPHPMDMLIDAHSGEVTTRTSGKGGKVETTSDHLDLPPDLANGLVPSVIENLAAGAAGTTVSMIVATPKAAAGQACYISRWRRHLFGDRRRSQGDSLRDQDRAGRRSWGLGPACWESAPEYTDLGYSG